MVKSDEAEASATGYKIFDSLSITNGETINQGKALAARPLYAQPPTWVPYRKLLPGFWWNPTYSWSWRGEVLIWSVVVEIPQAPKSSYLSQRKFDSLLYQKPMADLQICTSILPTLATGREMQNRSPSFPLPAHQFGTVCG
jgi:hypothetical protein